MRVVIQRVSECELFIENRFHSFIGKGLLVLLGIETDDTLEDVEWLTGKISRLRIFDDDAGVMNLPVNYANGRIMVVSQFTLHASTRKGNRPSYIRAAKPEIAIPLYEAFIAQMAKETGNEVASGIFGAHMNISLVNDGPVTIIIDSRNKE